MVALGASAIVWLISEAGAEEVAGYLEGAAPFLPILFAIEGLQIVCEAWATRMLLGERGAGTGRRVGFRQLLRIHLVGYAVCKSVPAGRSAAEAVKATMLAPAVGGARAFAVGAAGQALQLVANGAIALLCIAASFALTGASLLSFALIGYGVVTVVAGVAVQVVAKHAKLAEHLSRFPRVATSLRAFRDASRELPLMPAGPAFALILARLLQTVQFFILAAVVGIGAGIDIALLGQGIHGMAAFVGDLVPGQLGITEGAFRLTADLVGGGAAAAVTVPVLLHVIVIAWIVVGSLVPLIWRPPGPPGKGGDAQEEGVARVPPSVPPPAYEVG